MRKSIIALALSGFLAMQAAADEVQLQDNPPDRHVVVKGDTLWGISGKFLKQPWRWPEIWNMNKDQIKNPDLIYPGDLIVLDKSGKSPHLRLIKNAKYGSDGREVVKLSPQIRTELIKTSAIPAIPIADIEPFLSEPLVIEKNGLENAPAIVATEESRVVVGTGNIAYVDGIKDAVAFWQIFRPGTALVDPDTKEVLGYEATYLGDAKVNAHGSPSTIEITKSKQEINKGDRLVPAPSEFTRNYVPHAPEKTIKARIISAYGGGLREFGRNNIVTLNKGISDGIEVGHVLALYRNGDSVKPVQTDKDGTIKLPDERYGLVFVFRTFNRVSYALVVQSTRSVHILDNVQNP